MSTYQCFTYPLVRAYTDVSYRAYMVPGRTMSSLAGPQGADTPATLTSKLNRDFAVIEGQSETAGGQDETEEPRSR